LTYLNSAQPTYIKTTFGSAKQNLEKIEALDVYNKPQYDYDRSLKKYTLKMFGVPQGSPLSPLLATLGLANHMTEQYDCIMYADDGLFYGDNIKIP
jgi:hypothetical protein